MVVSPFCIKKMGLQEALVVMSPLANAGDVREVGLIPGGAGNEGGGLSWRRKWQPTPVFLPGQSYGQRSLEGYSP